MRKKRKFEELVSEAIDELPEQFRKRLENVDIVVENAPSPATLEDLDREENTMLLGLYTGVPLKDRGTSYGSVIPDIIHLYRKNIQALCANELELKRAIKEVLIHEIGHHFGMEEDDMR